MEKEEIERVKNDEQVRNLYIPDSPKAESIPNPLNVMSKVRAIMDAFKAKEVLGGELSGEEQEDLKKSVYTIEKQTVINGVDFSKIQIPKIFEAIAEGNLIEFETYSPYLNDHNQKTGEIFKEKRAKDEEIGLKTGGWFKEYLSGLRANFRVISLSDEYNSEASEEVDSFGRPVKGKQAEFPKDVRDRFLQETEDEMREAGIIEEDDVVGKDYLIISESSKQESAVELVRQLDEKGLIRRDPKNQEIIFHNPDAENPLYKSIRLRSKTGRWLCEALDASSFLNEENRDIFHIVVLPNGYKEQQNKVWEILRVHGIAPLNYHNIFYDPDQDPEVVRKTIENEFEKYRSTQELAA